VVANRQARAMRESTVQLRQQGAITLTMRDVSKLQILTVACQRLTQAYPMTKSPSWRGRTLTAALPERGICGKVVMVARVIVH